MTTWTHQPQITARFTPPAGPSGLIDQAKPCRVSFVTCRDGNCAPATELGARFNYFVSKDLTVEDRAVGGPAVARDAVKFNSKLEVNLQKMRRRLFPEFMGQVCSSPTYVITRRFGARVAIAIASAYEAAVLMEQGLDGTQPLSPQERLKIVRTLVLEADGGWVEAAHLAAIARQAVTQSAMSATQSRSHLWPTFRRKNG